MSTDLIWLLVKNNNSFLIKHNGVQFSSEPNNLTNSNSFKHSGLANKKSIGISPEPKGRGVVVTTKTKGVSYKPAKNTRKVVLSKGIRKSAKSIANSLTRAGYRPDLRKEALARMSAIYESQKPNKVHKKKTGRRHAKSAKKQK
ncbi:15239_t:CDS:2 [Entrophospora sp. SA101]|nr:15239_t:CDS:2 [Entrophospora sp. SA101]CAJ0823589.1 849_t:CDS:2 [Entrophospora sp. SA101]CAJ0843996.1 13895_t:CDS:2 [Entrophospora sp. SA101]